jgi:hypothetical protein
LGLGGGKRNGYFLEFGAASGKEKSNSYFLGTEMSWEPNSKFVDSVRRSCVVSNKYVYSKSGERAARDIHTVNLQISQRIPAFGSSRC